MIVQANLNTIHETQPACHKAFLALLGDIRRHTHRALRGMRGEAREDAFAEVVASCYVAFDRLCTLDKQDLAYPSVLVRYAVAQYFAGRRVGNRFRKRDVFSPANKRPVLHIDQRSGWHELLIDDHSTPVSDQAAFRIDFPAWLDSLSTKKRRVAEALAQGDSTNDVADEFGVSAGRISQLRREFAESWQEFHGPVSENGMTGQVGLPVMAS